MKKWLERLKVSPGNFTAWAKLLDPSQARTPFFWQVKGATCNSLRVGVGESWGSGVKCGPDKLAGACRHIAVSIPTPSGCCQTGLEANYNSFFSCQPHSTAPGPRPLALLEWEGVWGGPPPLCLRFVITFVHVPQYMDLDLPLNLFRQATSSGSESVNLCQIQE